jgi:hypothetical protein
VIHSFTGPGAVAVSPHAEARPSVDAVAAPAETCKNSRRVFENIIDRFLVISVLRRAQNSQD